VARLPPHPHRNQSQAERTWHLSMNQHPASEFEFPLSLLREAVAQSDLLPGAYARYRPVLADGLRFFLERLSPQRLRPLLAEQTQFPTRISTAERVAQLARHAPALHKLGQIVARDRRLHTGFRKRLQRLESMPPSMSSAEVGCLLGRAFPGWRRTGVQLGSEPLAEGSVAIIMPFTARDSRPGVFKLLKPGVEALLEEDLQILAALGSFLDEDCARYHLPAVSYRESFDTVRRLLVHEVHLEEEQHHLAEAARLFRDLDTVVIPELFPFCSRRVTAMERLWGTKLAEAPPTVRHSGRATARQLAEALVAGPLFSARADALFHADPHAGNLLLTPEGRLGILDWSLVGRLPKAEREAFVQLLLGALQLNLGQMAAALNQLASRPLELPAVEPILRESLRALRWGSFPGLGWLTGLLDDLVWRAGLRLPGHLMLFRKSLLTLEGVLADLLGTDSPAAWTVLDEAVLASFQEQWLREWPARLCAPLAARSFRTHLSAADLLALLWSGPLAWARAWTQTGLDLAQAASRVMTSTTGAALAGAALEKAR
jgi:ubiquinone biosynthesis protein